MRLFLSIDPSEEISHDLLKVREHLEDYTSYMRFVCTENVHLTIRFLGSEVSKDSLKKIKKVLDLEIKNFSKFNIRFNCVQFGMPGRKWPRILFVSVAKNEVLDQILSNLNHRIESYNLDDIELFRFSSNPVYHITLARVKRRLNKEVVEGIRKRIRRFEMLDGFRVTGVRLYESKLTNKGPEYTEIKSYNLL